MRAGRLVRRIVVALVIGGLVLESTAPHVEMLLRQAGVDLRARPTGRASDGG